MIANNNRWAGSRYAPNDFDMDKGYVSMCMPNGYEKLINKSFECGEEGE